MKGLCWSHYGFRFELTTLNVQYPTFLFPAFRREAPWIELTGRLSNKQRNVSKHCGIIEPDIPNHKSNLLSMLHFHNITHTECRSFIFVVLMNLLQRAILGLVYKE